MHGALGISVPHVKDVAHVLAPGTERLVSYHLVTEGKAIVAFPEMPPYRSKPATSLIIPHGDAHTVSNGSPCDFIDSGATLGNSWRAISRPCGWAAAAR